MTLWKRLCRQLLCSCVLYIAKPLVTCYRLFGRYFYRGDWIHILLYGHDRDGIFYLLRLPLLFILMTECCQEKENKMFLQKCVCVGARMRAGQELCIKNTGFYMIRSIKCDSYRGAVSYTHLP